VSPFRSIRFPASLCAEALRAALSRSVGEAKNVRASTRIQGSPLSCWYWNGRLFLADDPLCTDLDAVFPPHPESFFLAECIGKPFGNGAMLDVGCGSGILAVTGALRGWTVTAVDINQRALDATQFNAELNGAKVDTLKGNLTSSIPQREYSLCVANLPFEPTPEGCENYLHSDGGASGLAVIDQFIRELNGVCGTGGVALLPSFSLFANGSTNFEAMIRESGYLSSFDRCVLRLSQPMDLRLIFRRFPSRAWKRTWKAWSPKQFVIELAILRKSDQAGRFGGVFPIIFADRSWISPAEVRRIGKPNQRTFAAGALGDATPSPG
jgi:release factor glutamine methyltransferase